MVQLAQTLIDNRRNIQCMVQGLSLIHIFFAACYHIDGLVARKRYTALLEQVGLNEKLDFYVDGLSRGMKQRLCLARCLIHDPKLLILDEPASGLDPRARYEFKEIIRQLRKEGRTITVSYTHLFKNRQRLLYI